MRKKLEMSIKCCGKWNIDKFQRAKERRSFKWLHEKWRL